MRSILYYITGHGYGHAVRSIQVIRAIQEAAPDAQIHVRTTAPEWLFANLPRPVSYTSRGIDVGVVQPDSLRMDIAATLAACRDLHARMPLILEEEVSFVRARNIGLIAGDIPPACFAVGSRAHIPSVAITNFTWDVIYRAYARQHGEFAPLIEEMSRLYAQATLLLALPYPCDMEVFESVQPISWIARRSRLTREQARKTFGLPQYAVIVLLSFGGIGLDVFSLDRLQSMSEFYFVATGAGESRGNLRVLLPAQHSYEDLIRAVDVVVTKPGYGIVADVLAHRVPILYSDRGQFPEYPRLVSALDELATAEFIPQEELRSAELRSYLDRLLAKAPHWPEVQLSGARQAAEKLLGLLAWR